MRTSSRQARAAFPTFRRHPREGGNPESPNNVILAEAGTG